MADRAVEGGVAPRAARLRPDDLAAALRSARPALAGGAALGAVFLVHLPVLRHYFFNDDFVPLADIASRGTWAYLRDLFLMRDLTPNWRFLTGVFYLAAYRAFGLDPFPYLLAAVVVHTATAALLYRLLWRALGRALPAFFGATLFGLSAAHVPTVGQVTAFNNVLGAFLLMLAFVALYEGLERDRLAPWLAASVLAFVCAIAANESSALSAPVLGLLVLWKRAGRDGWWRDARAWTPVVVIALPFAVLALAAVAGFGACDCTEATVYEHGGHIYSNLWVYLGRLLYPIGLEFPGSVGTAHKVAGAVVLGLALLALARGPALGRIAAVWLVIAVVPYLPIGLWAAARYVYLASLPFALLAAVYADELSRGAARLAPAAPALVAFLALSAVGLVAWQAFEQNRAFADATDRWRTLVAAIERSDLDPVPGTTVYLRGGPVAEPLAQCTVLPSLGTVLWGEDVKLFSYAPEALPAYRVRPGYDVEVLDYDDGHFVRALAPAPDDPNAPLLPTIAPDATGNLCRLDVPLAE